MDTDVEEEEALTEEHVLPAAPTVRAAGGEEGGPQEEGPQEGRLQWSPTTRCYTPAMYRAETVVASVLSRLASQVGRLSSRLLPYICDFALGAYVAKWSALQLRLPVEHSNMQ